jgi:hypothetical protein
MDAYQQLITTLALTMGTAWAAGINLYATVAVLGTLGLTGNIVLPEQLVILQDPMVIGAAALMYLVEFFADKTPGVDTGWDTGTFQQLDGFCGGRCCGDWRLMGNAALSPGISHIFCCFSADRHLGTA